MSMIDRYRKKGGFVQLLLLIETSGKDKQEKFLKLISDENPAWEQEVRKKMLTMDRVLGWNQSYLMEILPRIPVMQLAMLTGAIPDEKKTYFMNVLGFRERKQVEDMVAEKKPGPAEASAAIMKLFAEVRKMVQEGALKFEKFDPEMAIPDNIEELLGKAKVLINAKEAEAAYTAAQAAEAPVPAGIPQNVIDELSQLRKKLVLLTQENHRLSQENQSMKDKLDQIKKIA
ncbi:MAG: hypothetical protein LW875_09690 [Proteobacteria bacterium]|jgi:hypothetical protein|nr:hypothetical protein [Pseudomonadota bacterium]